MLNTNELAAQPNDAAVDRIITSKSSNEILKIIVKKVIDKYEQHSFEADDYVKTGFRDFDDKFSGLNKGSLILLAGDYHSGKTNLICNIASNIALKQQKTVGIMSFQYSAEQLMKSILASESQIEMMRMDTGLLTQDDWKKLNLGIEQLLDANIQFAEPVFRTIEELLSNIEIMVTEHELEILAIDDFPFRFCSHDLQHSMQASERFAQSLRQLARKLNIPIILTAGISSRVHRRENHRPNLGDLSINGDITRGVDTVIFLYRDVLYYPDTESTKILELIVAKNKYRCISKVLLNYHTDFAKLKDYKHSQPLFDDT